MWWLWVDCCVYQKNKAILLYSFASYKRIWFDGGLLEFSLLRFKGKPRFQTYTVPSQVNKLQNILTSYDPDVVLRNITVTQRLIILNTTCSVVIKPTNMNFYLIVWSISLNWRPPQDTPSRYQYCRKKTHSQYFWKFKVIRNYKGSVYKIHFKIYLKKSRIF